MVAENKRLTMTQCFKDLLANEGVRGFYKGLAQPVLAGLPSSTIAFVGQAAVKRELNRVGIEGGLAPSYIAGFLSGIMTLFIYVPTDLMKCRAQLTKKGTLSYRREYRKIMATEGFKGLYRGFWVTFIRNTIGFGIYFGSF
mmetsp:Transcript_42144/g.64633  ORF Transcript_42144/g.64633 Transcript_42144/m.64633 type:complete len:141 (-) Transcript_42144:303-725(-)